MKKTVLSRMSWKEAQEAFSMSPVALIPLGSMEEHGPQTPMGDYRIIEKLAQKIAHKTNSIVVPVIPFGYSETFVQFPGTISVRPETLSSLVEDVCLCLISHGLDHMVFVNGHFENGPILEQVARKMRAAKGVILACISPYTFLTEEFLSELHGSEKANFGHGSEPMNSLNMYFYPEDVNMELAEKGGPRKFQGFDVKSMSQVKLKDVFANIYINMDDISPNGVMGNPFLASAEAGRKMADRLIEYGSIFVEQFKKVETRRKRS